MKTQDSVDTPTRQKETTHRKKRTKLATIGALLVVALIIAASAVVFAQLSQQHKNAALPPVGKWTAVLQGYTISSLVAANNSPDVLYACARRTSTNFTVLRSTDFGSHWQEVGSKAALGESCQLAINPTNSNDIFATSVSMSKGQATIMLKHSTDGGQNWASVQPTLHLTGSTSSTPVAWNVQELRFVGTTLFGLQWLPLNMRPTDQRGTLPKYFTRLARLVSSTDGGQTWKVVDAQFTAGGQSVSSYAVDPTNSSTIYELVSTPWLPIQPNKTETNDTIPTFGNVSSLYKTTDGGATWHLLLKSLPFGTQLQLASGKTQVLYVGGTRSPLPYIKETGTTNDTNNAQSGFNLQMSSDGGATWREVPSLPQASFVQNWFADKNGQVLINTGTGVAPGGESTAIVGTAIATTPITVPGLTPQSGTLPSISEHASAALTTPTSTTQTTAVIQRYDPSINTWSAVTKLPAYGVMLAITPGDTNSDVLWFLDTTNGKTTLYRFIA